MPLNAANGMVSNHKKNVVITAFVNVFTVLILEGSLRHVSFIAVILARYP